MHGDVAYCKKHGHDWEPLCTEGASLMVCRCRICGIEQVFL